MKWIFLFLLLIMSSCGKSNEEKALCETLKNMQSCGNQLNSENIEESTKCITKEANNLVQSMSGEKIIISNAQKQKVDSVASTYAQCVERIEKVNDLKNCLNTYINALENILECR